MWISKRDILWGEIGRGDCPPLELLVSTPHPLNRNINFFWEGGEQPFSVVILIRAMSILFPWNLNILYIIYYLSPNAFSYIVSAHFLDKECEGPCLVTWRTFLSSKDCIILVLKKLSYYIVFKRICINYLHKCTEYFFVFFIDKTSYWIFWKFYYLFLFAVYQFEHILC